MKRTLFTLTAVVALMVSLFGTTPQAYAQSDNEKYVVVDKDAEYPGGLEAMYL